MTETRITGPFSLDKLYTWEGSQYGPGEVTVLPCGLAKQLADTGVIPSLTSDQLMACRPVSEQGLAVVYRDYSGPSVEGTTTGTTFSSYTVPAGKLQPNSLVRISAGFRSEGATNKFVGIRFGGQVILNVPLSQAWLYVYREVRLRSLTEQLLTYRDLSAASIGNNATAPPLLSVNCANEVIINATGALSDASAGNKLTLDFFDVGIAV